MIIVENVLGCLHICCLDKSGKSPHEMISGRPYSTSGRPHLTKSEEIGRYRTNEPNNTYAYTPTCVPVVLFKIDTQGSYRHTLQRGTRISEPICNKGLTLEFVNH